MDKNWLEQKYLIEKLSLAKIGKELNCYSSTVRDYLKKYNIPIRSISQALKGRKLSSEHKEKVKLNIVKANLDRQKNGVSEEEKQRLRNIKPDRTGIQHSIETKQKMRQKALGRKNSDLTKLKMSATRKNNPKYSGENHPLYGVSREDMKGEQNPNWNGGTHPLNKAIRACIKYTQWRDACFKRDNYTCQICKIKGGILNIDHIKQFAVILFLNKITNIEEAFICSELWDVDNGRTLCISCHKKTDTFGSNTSKIIKNLKIGTVRKNDCDLTMEKV